VATAASIDTGHTPCLSSTDPAELIAAGKRIAELETELAIHRRSAELLAKVVSPRDAGEGGRAVGG
jgi:hypothetical protein